MPGGEGTAGSEASRAWGRLGCVGETGRVPGQEGGGLQRCRERGAEACRWAPVDPPGTACCDTP